MEAAITYSVASMAPVVARSAPEIANSVPAREGSGLPQITAGIHVATFGHTRYDPRTLSILPLRRV